MKYKTITLRSWSEFKTRIIEDNFPSGLFEKGTFLFRGQSVEDWKLISAFDRWYKGKPDEKFTTSNNLLAEFKKECELEVIPPETRNDEILMLSLGQHYGLPTRLLDWSESPYVASFFAFSGHIRLGLSIEKYVAIWVLNSKSYIWNKEHGCEILNVPSFGNERIKNQNGKFTYMRGPFSTLEEYVDKFNDETALTKYLIPANQAVIAMSDLDSMGINHSRIYPGIGGNAKAAEVRVMLNIKKNRTKA